MCKTCGYILHKILFTYYSLIFTLIFQIYFFLYLRFDSRSGNLPVSVHSQWQSQAWKMGRVVSGRVSDVKLVPESKYDPKRDQPKEAGKNLQERNKRGWDDCYNAQDNRNLWTCFKSHHPVLDYFDNYPLTSFINSMTHCVFSVNSSSKKSNQVN